MRTLHTYTLCVTLLCTTPVALQAQQWCPPGAEWYHDFFSGMTEEVGYVVTNYVDDTLIAGRSVHRLERYQHTYSHQTQNYSISGPGMIYTSVTDGLIETWNGVHFDTLFNFGAHPGDSWQIPGWSGIGTSSITVLDTGHVAKAGAWLRYLMLDFGPYSNLVNGTDTLFERMGLLNAYLDIVSAYISDGGIGSLRCYSDFDIAYARDSLSCNLILDVDEISAPLSLPRVYPNPGRNWFCIDGIIGTATLQLIDPKGTLLTQKPLRDEEIVDIGYLPTGSYLMRIITASGSFHLKWVKE